MKENFEGVFKITKEIVIVVEKKGIFKDIENFKKDKIFL